MKILIAMSGGVDSSTSAAILKNQGHDLVAVTFIVKKDGKLNPEFAKDVAKKLKIEHKVIDISDLFKREIIDYFVDSYLDGRTPNPCSKCNSVIKFGHVLEIGKKLGADKIATGHYAKIGRHKGYSLIQKAFDTKKDQSYFLSRIDKERIDDIIFPLGDYTKEKTREIAREFGLVDFDEKESQDICFVDKEMSYADFIEKNLSIGSSSGDITDQSGSKLGSHDGFYKYTIGQRKGLNISSPEGRLYVTKIDPSSNRITVGNEDLLYASRLLITDFVFHLPYDSIKTLDRIKAKIRYNSLEADVSIEPSEGSSLMLIFKEKIKSATKGQIVTLYYDDFVIGGGIIENIIS